MIVGINEAFDNISRKLYRNSLNYCANFKLFLCDPTRGDSLEGLVRSAIGDGATIASSEVATQQEVMKALTDALRFRGSDDSHPSLEYLGSPESQQDFRSVTSDIQTILDRSNRVVSLLIYDGHPFYPVFWDFAFLIQSDDEAIVFIASSSD